VDEDVRLAAESGRARRGDAEDERGGDRGVDGVAAALWQLAARSAGRKIESAHGG
jgi:hypothetical protein